MNAHATPTLFDYAEAVRRRDAGMATAASHSPAWSELAYQAIKRVAQKQIHIHVDDLIAAGLPQPHHYNCWGSVWLRAIQDDLIQRSRETRPSKQPGKHAHRYPVYFSRVYEATR